MVAPADVQQRRSAGAHPYGESIVAVAFDDGCPGTPALPYCENRLLDNRGPGGIEGGRPQARDAACRIRFDLYVGDDGGARQCGIIRVDGNPLVRAEQAQAWQLDLTGQKDVACAQSSEGTAGEKADPVLLQLGRGAGRLPCRVPGQIVVP